MTDDQFGPNTAAVEAFLLLLHSVTCDEWEQVATAWNPEPHSDRSDADDAAWRSIQDLDLVHAWWAIRDPAWDALWVARAESLDAAWAASRDAVRALVVRDHITPEQYTILVAPFAGIARFAAVLDPRQGHAMSPPIITATYTDPTGLHLDITLDGNRWFVSARGNRVGWIVVRGTKSGNPKYVPSVGRWNGPWNEMDDRLADRHTLAGALQGICDHWGAGALTGTYWDDAQ